MQHSNKILATCVKHMQHPDKTLAVTYSQTDETFFFKALAAYH
jgi:hypothetical protein